MDIGRGSFHNSINVSMKEVGFGRGVVRGTEKVYVAGCLLSIANLGVVGLVDVVESPLVDMPHCITSRIIWKSSIVASLSEVRGGS